ncbi:MAG: sugar transferase [Oscillospiraceae bacterium]|nr:sugar transferase [Oscillospiraceae bacterium]
MQNETVSNDAIKSSLIKKVAKKPIYSLFKRIFDIFFSVLALIVLFVPLCIISLIIVIDCPGASPIYVQHRVGKNGKIFKFYKFRSMIPNADNLLDALLQENEMDGPAFKIKDDPRITRFGRFIRQSSIDELPQLFNVLIGDMSLVGPRPPILREVEMYNEEQMQRLAVIPGITGFWQVQPRRNSLSFDEWLALDVKYINERSFKIDLIILYKTVGAVLGMEGE